MRIFIDGNGRYYKQDLPKDIGDSEFTHPTPEMLNFITEVPITRVEFESLRMQKQSEVQPTEGAQNAAQEQV